MQLGQADLSSESFGPANPCASTGLSGQLGQSGQEHFNLEMVPGMFMSSEI